MRDVGSEKTQTQERTKIQDFVTKYFAQVQPGPVIEEPCIYTVRHDR